MKLKTDNDFLMQFLALLVAAVIIHSIFVLVIRPEADRQLQVAEENNQPPPRSLVIVLKDYEQEACFILLCWAVGIIGIKARGHSKLPGFTRSIVA